MHKLRVFFKNSFFSINLIRIVTFLICLIIILRLKQINRKSEFYSNKSF